MFQKKKKKGWENVTADFRKSDSTITHFQKFANFAGSFYVQKQPPEEFYDKAAKFTAKHLCWSLFLIKLQALLEKTPTQVFSYEYCEIFKNTYFQEHLFGRCFKFEIRLLKQAALRYFKVF